MPSLKSPKSDKLAYLSKRLSAVVLWIVKDVLRCLRCVCVLTGNSCGDEWSACGVEGVWHYDMVPSPIT